jgi:hypothetical protein
VSIVTRSAAALVALIALTPVVRGQPAATRRVDEYQLKAAVLYNLARFVEWPPDAFAGPSAPLSICVLGVDPFGAALDEAVRGHRVGDRPLATRRMTDVASGCHVLFIANSERRRLPAVVDQLRDTAALTVGEVEDFTLHGGMVGLTTAGDQIKFDINVAAATKARLKISARLMALASGARRTAGQP